MDSTNASTTNSVIGIVYLSMGMFGILENGVTAYMMATDPHMRNPTYYYMINLSITDVLILIPIAVYSGLLLLWPYLSVPIYIRIGAWLVAIGWYPGCLFMVFASFSRYVQLAMPHNVPTIFSRRNLILSISLSWIVPALLYTWFIYYDPMPFHFKPDAYTWNFNRDDVFGNALSIVNITVNSIFAIFINFCNVKSSLCVHNMRKQIQSFENTGNLKREVKLFAQCAITGTIYTAAVIYYFVVSALESSMKWYTFLLTHLLWTSNHLQNPIIYFVLNTRLRRRILRILFPKRFMQVHSTVAPPMMGTSMGTTTPVSMHKTVIL